MSLVEAMSRHVGRVLRTEGFRREKRCWWLQSDLGDYAVVEVGRSRSETGFIETSVVPGPWRAWLHWIIPDLERGQGPRAMDGVLRQRVRPPDPGWILFIYEDTEPTIRDWLVQELTSSVVPRLRRCFDRAVLLSEVLPASGEEQLLRAGFLAEAGDAAGADAVLGPAEDDDENLARFRRWIHLYAASPS